MRRLRLFALVASVGLLAISVASGMAAGRRQLQAELDHGLGSAAGERAAALSEYFERARSINLLTAHNPAFAEFNHAAGDREAKLRAGGPLVARADDALAYLEELYPGRIGEACFIDQSGAENARVVRGAVAGTSELSLEEAEAPFFAPTFALPDGQVYQAQPYVSPDTNEWVISNSTVVPDGRRGSLVHFEVTIDSFRTEADAAARRYDITLVDGRTGAVVSDSRFPQRVGAPLGRPDDGTYRSIAMRNEPSGTITLNQRRAAYRRIDTGGPANANDWYVVASAPVAVAGLSSGFGGGQLALMVAALLLLGFVGTSFRAHQRALRAAAVTDALTGLPNRTLFQDRLRQVSAAARREGALAAVMILDLDRFKEVNDTLGHHRGDELLIEAGRRLQECVRHGDTIARLGGDEFGVLLPAIVSGEHVTALARRMCAALEAPFVLDGVPVHVAGSVGVAVVPDHGHDAETLVQHADVAMYQAKRSHTGFAVYSPETDSYSPQRLSLAAELRAAIDQRQLVLHYQPKLNLLTGRVQAVEALVRWQHPRLGLLAPSEFITLAEDTGLIKPLAIEVLGLALSQCRAWLDEGYQLAVAVNLSARNLTDPHLPDAIAGLLARWEVPARMLKIELTESAVMHDRDHAVDVLDRLSGMGLQLSVDDFGTGYSSLAYLKQLPIDELKIDRQFVAAMTSNSTDAFIVRSTIDLGRNLGLDVVAEGVEDDATLRQLLGLGCGTAQGYYVCKPVPAEQLADQLAPHTIETVTTTAASTGP